MSRKKRMIMKYKEKINWTLVILWVVIAVLVVFALICIGWSIYAFVKYGDKPITEIPAWALRFMFKG